MTDNMNENEVASAVQKESAAPAPVKGMKEKNIDAVSKKQLAMKILVKIALYAFLGFMALIVLFPFYWMLISSVKTEAEYNQLVPTLWPQQFRWSTYADAFTGSLNLGGLLWHTVLVGVISTVLSLIITVLSAYAFARLEFRGKNILFTVLLATMMIPGELFTVTNFATVKQFGWLDSNVGVYTAYIIPFLVSVFYIFLLRQNFMQIPNELYLAAKVDGTSDLKYLWKVMIPLAAPTLISITILKMMGAWNSYMWPNLISSSKVTELITVGIRKHDFGTPIPDFPAQMAAVVLVTIPLILVFLFLRKYIMRGVSRSGIKG